MNPPMDPSISLRVHAEASLTGSCEIRIGGVPYDTKLRYINTVHVTTVTPSGASNTLNITPPS